MLTTRFLATFLLRQTWLSETLAGLLAETPDLSRQLQIKGCHRALLQSDLARSAIGGTGLPSGLIKDADGEPLHDQVIFGDVKGCLVMVVGITEVGLQCWNCSRLGHQADCLMHDTLRCAHEPHPGRLLGLQPAQEPPGAARGSQGHGSHPATRRRG
jgi:hypothetical protein